MSLNVCLYGRRNHWSMTERGSEALSRSASEFTVGPSSMRWEDGALTIEFDERAVPTLKRLRGRVRLVPDFVNEQCFSIAPGHSWRPIAPEAQIEVDVPSVGLSWRGRGYHDTNMGRTGLEDDFRRWDWSRAKSSRGDTAILYDVEPRHSANHTIALKFDNKGRVERFDPPARQQLRRGLWGVRRNVQCDDDSAPRIIKALEDAPFYTRAEVASRLFGEDVMSVHECLDGDRFGSAWVKALLPFRMPRRV